MTPLEIIRIRHHLTMWKNITNTLPDGWVNKLRKLFELRYETSQLIRTETGEITHYDGYFGLIDPGAYVNGSTERLWQSFIRGAIAQKLIDKE